MSKFNKGDKVVYISNHDPDNPAREQGIVVEATMNTFKVRIRGQVWTCDPRWASHRQGKAA